MTKIIQMTTLLSKIMKPEIDKLITDNKIAFAMKINFLEAFLTTKIETNWAMGSASAT